MEDETESIVTEMYNWSCATCGCVMSMPSEFNEQLRRDHKTFYCLSGHANYYSKKTDTEKLELQLVSEYSKNAQLEAEIKKLKRTLLNRILPPK